jgi:hypothetical protein
MLREIGDTNGVQEQERQTIYKPQPRDRDQAFSDGALISAYEYSCFAPHANF